MAFLWTQRQDIGPTARFDHAVAYDEAMSKTLLVGGNGLGTLFRDTWLWDGETWTQVDDIGPSGRAGHAITYDSGRERVVLFGGSDGGDQLGDTWEWDGEAWTQLEDTGPTPRQGHALSYDSARSRVVLFGGEEPQRAPATRGSGMGTSGRRSPTPGRAPVQVTQCASRTRLAVRCSSAVLDIGYLGVGRNRLDAAQ